MYNDYSIEWTDLISQLNKLEESAFRYNQLDKNIMERDLKNALNQKDELKVLRIVKMMSEEILFANSIELVLEDLVQIVVYGNEECIGYAMNAIGHLNIKKWRNEIIKYIYKYTEKYKKDPFVFRYAWRLLYNLNLKKELLNYIDMYKEQLRYEITGDDKADIERLTEFV